ncbi:MAG: hypothetical protein CMM48_01270 [Rhodospirillaceae bacterium]|nr:hypothetical protein [Rhodospirillaceae bacterium]
MSRFENFATRECLLPMVEMEDFSPAYREIAEEAVARTGRLSNSTKAMAHGGDMAASTRDFFAIATAGGSLGKEFALLIRLVVPNLNACIYCSTHQVKALEKLGLEREKIDNAHAFETHPAFNDRERTALSFAAALTRDSANIPDDLCERFCAEFSPQERVEIALVTCAMGVFNKFNDGMRVPLEDGAMETAEKVAAALD